MTKLSFVLFLIILSLNNITSQTISGKIYTDGKPAEGSVVKIRATNICDTTGINGEFMLPIKNSSDLLTVTAWKEGYYISGSSAYPGDDSVFIFLEPYTKIDHPEYEWMLPAPASEKDIRCINCHNGSVVPEWKGNLHSKSATDLLVLNMYNGTDVYGNKNVGPGYKLDQPGSAGSCANCHAPTAALKSGSWQTDLNNITGVDTNGVHCDYCHKINNTRIDQYGSSPGFLSIDLIRPSDNRQLFFGSLDDVPADDSYNQLYKKSRICAPCHQYKNGNVMIYGSFPEWQASQFARDGIQCQDCHMKPNGITTNIAPADGGVERDPMTIPSHLQMGGNDSLFIAESVEMDLVSYTDENSLNVEVAVSNVGGGHHFPTGNPIRNAVLVIEAFDQDENELTAKGTNLIPDWGGKGNDDNDYAGKPGKVFAKILMDADKIIPAPQWRAATVYEDTRIPADKTDYSFYTFNLPENIEEIALKAKLIYRKSFKTLSDIKGWDLKDYLLKEIDQKIEYTGVKTDQDNLAGPRLINNFPNPFNNSTTIEFELAENSFVRLEIFDLNGNKIKTLFKGVSEAGKKSFEWNGTNNRNRKVASGIYVYTLETGKKTISKKMNLLK